MSVDHAWPYLKRTQLQCVICTHVCEQPALVCHGQQLPCVRRLRSSGFTPTLGSAVALHRRDSGLGISHARLPEELGLHEMRSFKIYGIWPQVSKQTYTQLPQKQSRLVWGSLRLAPINHCIAIRMVTYCR